VGWKQLITQTHTILGTFAKNLDTIGYQDNIYDHIDQLIFNTFLFNWYTFKNV